MKANGSPEPIFETDDERSYFLIRLPVHKGFLVDTEAVANVSHKVTEQVIRLLQALLKGPLSTRLLMKMLSLTHRPTFIQNYLQPALDLTLIEMTQPDSPRSPTQKYRLTDLGEQVLASKDKH